MTEARLVTHNDLLDAMVKARSQVDFGSPKQYAAAVWRLLPAAAPAEPEKQLWRRHGRYGKWDHDPDTADVAYECEELGEGCKLHKPGQFAAAPADDHTHDFRGTPTRCTYPGCMAAAPAEPARAYCGDCDGVGWYEGGEALQTQCERCNGTGWADGKP